MKLRVFASGSKGNCLMAESSGGVRLLVDMGISYGAAIKRMATCSVAPASVDAVLFTHEHSDHIKGAAMFRKKHPLVPFYANEPTARAMMRSCALDLAPFMVFTTSSPFDVGDFEILPVATSHDTLEPVAFLLRDAADGKTLFVGTDTGYATPGFRKAFSMADCAVLEANYEDALLWNSARSEFLKMRIASDVGHLSNDDAAEIVRACASERLKILLAAHRSQECNEPSLVEKALSRALAEAGLEDVRFSLLEQDFPSALWVF